MVMNLKKVNKSAEKCDNSFPYYKTNFIELKMWKNVQWRDLRIKRINCEKSNDFTCTVCRLINNARNCTKLVDNAHHQEYRPLLSSPQYYRSELNWKNSTIDIFQKEQNHILCVHFLEKVFILDDSQIDLLFYKVHYKVNIKWGKKNSVNLFLFRREYRPVS